MSTAHERFTATLGQLRPSEIAKSRPGRFSLGVSTADAQRTFTVDGSHISIGAHAASNLVLKDPLVSSVHCELQAEDDGVILRDLGSKNGTWIGSTTRIHEVWLRPGATFSVGGYTITLQEIRAVDVPVSMAGRFGELHGSGTKMGELFSKLERLAAVELDVLIVGETGTGKELIARGIHDKSDRSDGPFIIVDCTNLNEALAEGILFGHRKGSFTGALADQAGLIEQSHGGTLFLDEIGELPINLQPKLLRALEEHGVRRIGESDYRRFDARIVAATNRDLLRMVGEGTFRDDLYFRIAQVKLGVPALRDRGRGDILLLAELFLERFATRQKRALRLSKEACTLVESHPWPGNVRQLRNAIRCAAVWAEDNEICIGDFPPIDAIPQQGSEVTKATEALFGQIEEALNLPLADARGVFEKVYTSRLLSSTDGNQSEAARRSGMSRSAFRELVKRVDRP